MKKHTSRFLAFFLAITMVFSCAVMLTGCGSSKSDDDDEEKEETIKSTWKTPIESYFKKFFPDYKLDVKDLYVNQFGGFGKSQLETIYKIASKSDYFEDYLYYEEEDLEDYHNNCEIGYGENWTLSYEIGDKTELDEDDLDSLKSSYLIECGERLIEEGEYILDMDQDELESLADDMGLSDKDLEKIGKALKELGELLTGVKVKNGYNVALTFTLGGDDDSDTSDMDLDVIEADGIWLIARFMDYSDVLAPLYEINYTDSY